MYSTQPIYQNGAEEEIRENLLESASTAELPLAYITPAERVEIIKNVKNKKVPWDQIPATH